MYACHRVKRNGEPAASSKARRPPGGAVEGGPHLPRGGRPSRPRCSNSLTRQTVRDCVIFPENMADHAVGTQRRKSLRKFATFVQQDAQVFAVTSPLARHHHDDEHGVAFEHKSRARVSERASQTCAETRKLRHVASGRVRQNPGSRSVRRVRGSGVHIPPSCAPRRDQGAAGSLVEPPVPLKMPRVAWLVRRGP